MPGISYICSLRGDLGIPKKEVLKSLDSMVHSGRYRRNILIDDNNYVLGCTLYDEYPLASFEYGDLVICLEGQIFGLDSIALEKELRRLADFLMGDSGIEDGFSRWLLDTDGAFVIFILNRKTCEIVLMNDSLGNLPMYYCRDGDTFMISRESRFITNLMRRKEIERTSMAQYLLLGTTLGGGTLLKDVFRLPHSTLIRMDLKAGRMEMKSLDRYNFEKKENAGKDVRQNAGNLVSIFTRTCLSRVSSDASYGNVLSLSGGLDSRAVGACLHENHIPFSAATKLCRDGSNKNDVETAKQLSGLFNADWHLVELLPQKGGDYLKLLKMKNGFNYLLMSDILFYYDRLMEIFGPRINFFTGDGGDRTITGFKPYRNLKRIEDLLDYTISTNRVFGLDEVSGLTGVPKDHITGELESHVSGYPERDFNHKYVHFMIYENAMNWVNEGTDRNRYYFRLQNPLWSIRLFDYALNCPDGQKSHYRLYREFFKRLSPRACAVNYANFNAPLTSKRLMMKLFIISKLPRGFKTAVKKRLDGHFRPHGANSSLSACLEDQINGCAPIGDFLSLSGIRGSIKNLNKVQLNVLFTLTSFMEELGGNGSTLERYKEAVLV